jgi:hypothetical protein
MEIFVKDSNLIDHYEYQDKQLFETIKDTLVNCFEHGICSQTTKCRILACALARKDHELIKFLMLSNVYGLKEILRTCFMLDYKRYVNQLKKKLKILEKQKNKPETKIKKTIKEIDQNEKMGQGMGSTDGFSLSGSKLRTIRKAWVQKVPKEVLEYDAMSMPLRQWQRLANMLHIRKEDFQLEWFLEYLFDNSKAPKDSMLGEFNEIKQDNFIQFVSKYKPPYSSLRGMIKMKKLEMTDELKTLIVSYTKLDDVLWYWEELNNDDVNKEIIKKIEYGEKIELNYGKLMERLLVIREKGCYQVYKKLIEIAESKLGNYKINLGNSVAVFGDASSSMDIAIKTSNIISSLLSTLCDSKLHFFNDKDKEVDPPKNVDEVIEFSNKYKASGCTAPVASLVKYYDAKIIVNTIIIVTDEEENTTTTGNWFATDFGYQTYDYQSDDDQHTNTEDNFDPAKGYSFSKLMKKYINEVNSDIRIVFITFWKSTEDGFMVKQLRKDIPMIDEKMMQFKMDLKRPDLTKLDKIIYTLSNWK